MTGSGRSDGRAVKSRVAIALTAMLVVLAPAAARADEQPTGAFARAASVAGLAVPASASGLSLADLRRGPSRRLGAAVARIVAPTFARLRPRLARQGWPLGVQTAWSRQPQSLLVLDAAFREGREWLKLLLPVRPNGSAGWVPRDRVVLGRTSYWVQIRTGARRVSVYRHGRRVLRFPAVVGEPATPTPLGLAAIYERNRQPNPRAFLGTWALPLTIMSNVLDSFGGGPGRVGIHGRAGASLLDPLGSARSHGCIRIPNGHVSWIAANVPAGTPVWIRR